MKRFYLNISFNLGEIINAPSEIARHMNVLRVKAGEIIELFDGNNESCQSEIISLDKRSAILKIIKKNQPTPIPAVTVSLAIAMVANDKMDLIVQKAVELGVNNIIPIFTKHSARLVSERSANRLNHWQNIIISSCCQCGQNLLPTIALPIPINSLYENFEYDVKIIMNVPSVDCHARPCLTGNDDLRENDNSSIRSAVLLVGPEGGFDFEESKMATLHNYGSLQLGNLIMRAETAVIAGLSVLNLCLRTWSRLPGNDICV